MQLKWNFSALLTRQLLDPAKISIGTVKFKTQHFVWNEYRVTKVNLIRLPSSTISIFCHRPFPYAFLKVNFRNFPFHYVDISQNIFGQFCSGYSIRYNNFVILINRGGIRTRNFRMTIQLTRSPTPYPLGHTISFS